jgi:hypothetical protein
MIRIDGVHAGGEEATAGCTRPGLHAPTSSYLTWPMEDAKSSDARRRNINGLCAISL